jgi:hypothetical protein
MFQDALFVPDRGWRVRAAALPAAALLHAVALTLLVTLPLVKAPDLPPVAVSDVLVVPALPVTPLPPPKARAGNPGGRLRVRRAPVAAGEAWRFAPSGPGSTISSASPPPSPSWPWEMSSPPGSSAASSPFTPNLPA